MILQCLHVSMFVNIEDEVITGSVILHCLLLSCIVLYSHVGLLYYWRQPTRRLPTRIVTIGLLMNNGEEKVVRVFIVNNYSLRHEKWVCGAVV